MGVEIEYTPGYTETTVHVEEEDLGYVYPPAPPPPPPAPTYEVHYHATPTPRRRRSYNRGEGKGGSGGVVGGILAGIIIIALVVLAIVAVNQGWLEGSKSKRPQSTPVSYSPPRPVYRQPPPPKVTIRQIPSGPGPQPSEHTNPDGTISYYVWGNGQWLEKRKRQTTVFTHKTVPAKVKVRYT